jgi:hypothetical protein
MLPIYVLTIVVRPEVNNFLNALEGPEPQSYKLGREGPTGYEQSKGNTLNRMMRTAAS